MNFDGEFSLTVDGQSVAPSATTPVINPASGKVFAHAPAADSAILDLAVQSSAKAFLSWRATGWAHRRQMLCALADAIDLQADGLASLFTREQGRPLPQARREIVAGADWLRAVAGFDIPIDVVEDSEVCRVEVHHEPLGVVAAIVPWNFPFLLAIWKIAPALITGNTVVLKPSPYTPLCALKLGEIARNILPPGVLNVVSGDDMLGPLMSSHSGFAKITFTGSTATGKRVMEAAAQHLTRVTLELGGNDAAIVLPDADVNSVAEALFAGAFFNSAQVCIATKRLYVHTDIYDAFRDRLHSHLLASVVGDGSDPGVTHGPVQNAAQFRRVKGLIDDAEAAGLTILRGSEVPSGEGYFIPLTLVDNPSDDAAVVREEPFGPVLPILRYEDVDEVIRRANDSEYGLAGSIWGDEVTARQIALRIETGTIWINQSRRVAPHVPFSGAKQSGLGIENGREGLLEFTQTKTISVAK